MTIDDAHAEMKNWSRWTHDHALPPLDIPEPPIFAFWRPHGDGREPGWGEVVPGDRIEDPIDWLAAERTDYLLRRLRVREFVCLHRHYHQHRTQPELELRSALRALCDLAGVMQKRLDRLGKICKSAPRGTLVPKIHEPAQAGFCVSGEAPVSASIRGSLAVSGL